MTMTAAWTALDGVSCADDGQSCTTDTCASGSCVHPHDSGSNTCLINGTCYNPGQLRPTNPCQVCDPGRNRSGWSAVVCDDGQSCTIDTCSGGTCTFTHDASNTCLVGGTCYNPADVDPGNWCKVCKPESFRDRFSDRVCDDSLLCTENLCDSGAQACDFSQVASGKCHIGGLCYHAGDATNDGCLKCETITPTPKVASAMPANCSSEKGRRPSIISISTMKAGEVV